MKFYNGDPRKKKTTLKYLCQPYRLQITQLLCMLKELNGERENEAEGNLIKPTSVKILPQTMKKD